MTPRRLATTRFVRVLRYAAPYRWGWAMIAAATLAGTACALLQPWPMQLLADQVLGGKPWPAWLSHLAATFPSLGSPRELLPWIAVSSVVLFTLGAAADAFLTVCWVRVGQRMVYDLARDLFGRLLRRSVLFHSRSQLGDSLSRVTGDSWCAYTLVDAVLLGPAHAILTAAAVSAVMARMDARLTVISLAVAPLMAVTSYLTGRPVHRVARVRRDVESSLNSHLQQTLSGVLIVQAFGQELRERLRFLALTRTALRVQRRTVIVESAAGFVSGTITAVGVAIVLWIGAHRVLSGQLTVGTLLVFLAYLNVLQGQLKSLAGTWTVIQGARASIDRVMEVLETPPEVLDPPKPLPLPPPRGHVRLEDVRFEYEPGRPVLRGVDLDVRAGETVALVGSTGAGKSTLALLLPRLLDATGGRVLLDGADARDWPLTELRRHVAFAPQEPLLFPIPVGHNIAYGKLNADGAEVALAARLAGAHAFVQRLSEGYETILGERGATLSGGERQRVALARALLVDAPVLVLDEPTSALDAETERQVVDAILAARRDKTTIIIAHRLSTARHADRVVVLQDGQVIEQGNHEELIRRSGVYQHLYRIQSAQPATTAAGGRDAVPA